MSIPSPPPTIHDFSQTPLRTPLTLEGTNTPNYIHPIGAGVLLALLLLERCGRKGTQAITYLVAAGGAGVLGLASAVTVRNQEGRAYLYILF